MKISLDEIYRRVWETPVTKLAKEFDISDVGLAKVCRKNQIPLPPVGSWAKVQHGRKVSRPPLAKSPIDEIMFVVFWAVTEHSHSQELNYAFTVTAQKSVLQKRRYWECLQNKSQYLTVKAANATDIRVHSEGKPSKYRRSGICGGRCTSRALEGR